MKSTSIIRASVAASLAILAIGAEAVVTVNFVEPEKYTDMPFGFYDKQRVMDELKKHFDKMAAALPPGQDLKVDVLDIDISESNA